MNYIILHIYIYIFFSIHKHFFQIDKKQKFLVIKIYFKVTVDWTELLQANMWKNIFSIIFQPVSIKPLMSIENEINSLYLHCIRYISIIKKIIRIVFFPFILLLFFCICFLIIILSNDVVWQILNSKDNGWPNEPFSTLFICFAIL